MIYKHDLKKIQRGLESIYIYKTLHCLASVWQLAAKMTLQENLIHQDDDSLGFTFL